MKTKLITAGIVAFSIAARAQWTNQSSSIECISKRVGINTCAPSYELDVHTPNANDGIRIVKTDLSGTGIGACGLYLDNMTQRGRLWSILSLGKQDAAGAGKFGIYDNKANLPRFIIDTLGHVGIGINSPEPAKLYVNYDVTNAGLSDMWGSRSVITQVNSPFSYLPLTGAEGNASANYVRTGELRGVGGFATNGFYNYGGYFHATASDGCYGDEAFGVKAIATGGEYTYGIWAEANGYDGDCGNHYAGYFNGDVIKTGSDNFSSDRKLKKEIAPLTNTLDRIMKLKPRTYMFRNDEFKTLNLPEGKQMGLIAQELEEVFPELVTTIAASHSTDSEGRKVEHTPEFKAVRYVNLIPLLIGAIQEQEVKMETQSALIASQQKQLDEQKQLIESLTQKSSDATGLGSMNMIEAGFQMSQNEPNPFTHETVVKYTLPQTVSNAFMAVYDLTGKQITTFPIEQKGSSSLTITSEKLAAGIYIYSIVADGKIMDSKKMVVSEK